ncbi:MAG: DUF4838 domain-containing protein [Lentisphaeria bacterium]|nr:DUF4838 domain-containing protein [Lentisphaeria bacterium]
MKKTGFLSVALLLCAVSLYGGRGDFQPKLPRHTGIDKSVSVELVKNGVPGFELVRGSSNVAKFAAEEAAAVLSKAIGVKIPILTKASGKVPAVIIGDAAYAAKNGIDLKKLDRDGFVIRTVGKDVLIIGRDDPKKRPLNDVKGYGLMAERGSLYGTYDFLERFAGVRFYFPGEGGTVIPPMKEWSLPRIDIYDRPDHCQRRISCGNVCSFDGLPANTRALNHQRLRLETMAIPNCHGLASLEFIQRFKESHPEYFALQRNGLRHFDTKAARPSSRKGHICFSSGIDKVIVDDAEAFLTGMDSKTRGISYWSWSRFPKGVPYFNIMLNDCDYPCQCEKCKPHWNTPQEHSDFIWAFFSRIANEAKQRNLPGDLTTMAYGNYGRVPPFDIPDNLLVMLAMRGPWNDLSPKAHAKDMKRLVDWTAKLRSKTWLWTYPRKGDDAIDGIPDYAPAAVGRFFKETAPYIFGTYMEAETDVYLFSALNYYVFSRVAWNNQTDVEALLEEYFRKMYGPAAGEMAEIGKILEKTWLTCAGRFAETPEGSKTDFPSEVELWTKFYGEETLKRVGALFARAEKKAAADPAALVRVRFMREKLWNKVLAARTKWLAATSSRENWTAVMPENKWSEPLWLRPVGVKKGKTVEAPAAAIVRIKRDAENFYFKFDCEEPHTDAMVAPKRPAGYARLWDDNTVEVQLVPAGQGTTRFQFIVSSSGCLQELRHNGKIVEKNWHGGAKVRTAVTPGKSFTVELTVPRKSLPAPVPGKFLANFNRCRILKGVSCHPHYTWSFFARSFGDQDNFGRILFEDRSAPRLLQDGDFAGPVKGRWLGKWFTSKKPPEKDKTDFVFGGESLRLPGGETLAQYFDFKPNTEYILTFWLKMADKTQFDVRIDEGNDYVTKCPRRKIAGPQKWMRQEYRFKTHGKKPTRQPYLRFQAFGEGGAVWLDRAELSEVTPK